MTRVQRRVLFEIEHGARIVLVSDADEPTEDPDAQRILIGYTADDFWTEAVQTRTLLSLVHSGHLTWEQAVL